jgi:hypothetical protein
LSYAIKQTLIGLQIQAAIPILELCLLDNLDESTNVLVPADVLLMHPKDSANSLPIGIFNGFSNIIEGAERQCT